MRRRLPLAALMMTALVVAALWPSIAEAQRRRPGRGPVGRPVTVVRGGYYGNPFFSPFWGFYPQYRYPLFGYPQRFYRYAYGQTASIRLLVTPKDTQVFVDGYFAGMVEEFDGTFQRLRLPPGQHELVLYLTGYHSLKQTLQLVPGKDFTVRHAMAPLAPGEADDPRPVPAAPPPPQALPPPEAIPPRAGPPEARGFGSLAIRVQPADAEVLIDGDRWQGPDSQDRLIVQVSEGTHRIEIRKAGYVTFSTDIEVRRGEMATLNVSLPPRDPR